MRYIAQLDKMKRLHKHVLRHLRWSAPLPKKATLELETVFRLSENENVKYILDEVGMSNI